ncbi:helix-turn-helix domain-containing protein [Rhizosphaericola mali]|uniref:Helix-turn-helix domain-containing protein n=1 Tax=Rhizosphaericola mali TaxID=2545455 RepID=A0A5P2G2M1_9BACT|nr:helix-turn-helix domain-containing protein [Rhizosphaericola mali]QES88050.1 helix-turn-helix domain-containing protein [Rhizosphaericola mali]QES88769.1 helix-turn-helix domain-containing protein [Rhizosphaericola mali]
MKFQNIKSTNYSHLLDPSKFVVSELTQNHNNKIFKTNQVLLFKMFWYHENINRNEDASRLNTILFVPPSQTLNKSIFYEEGFIIAFDREYLQEDDKEFSIDVFNLFNSDEQNRKLIISKEVEDNLNHVMQLMRFEVDNEFGSFLVLKPLVKVFLLQLIRLSQNKFLKQDVHQKRIYQFLMLLEENFITQRKCSFYANHLGLSAKRLNQILNTKMNTTVTQQIHSRLLLEAKRMLVESELTIKEIAYNLQFNDHSYFSRFFKKNSGFTPEEYKKHN